MRSRQPHASQRADGFASGCFHLAIPLSQPCAHFRRLVIERPHSAAVGDSSVLIDDVQPLRPRCIGVIRSILHVIHAERKWILETLNKIIRNCEPVRKIARLRIADIIFHVGFHLPLVGGMRFAHINRQKISVIFIVIENLHDVADLATERRSSETAKNDDQRFRSGAFANMKRFRAIEGVNPRIRRAIADF